MRCHRQPLCLFDEAELRSLPKQPEELVLSILALTTRFSSKAYFQRDKEAMAQRFYDAAKSLVMLRIANASVKFSTIQAICLLACAGFAGSFDIL
jgi:hypothetical protein